MEFAHDNIDSGDKGGGRQWCCANMWGVIHFCPEGEINNVGQTIMSIGGVPFYFDFNVNDDNATIAAGPYLLGGGGFAFRCFIANSTPRWLLWRVTLVRHFLLP